VALLKLQRHAQVIIPADLRRQFNLQEGDDLEAEAVKDGILLRPVSLLAREQGDSATLRPELESCLPAGAPAGLAANTRGHGTSRRSGVILGPKRPGARRRDCSNSRRPVKASIHQAFPLVFS
jgi:AbrB family looped-hinge helix DNA binding protein